MKLEEVLPALREGKKIRAKGWRPECYIMCNKDEFIDERGHEFGFMTIGHLKADWEIVPEPTRVADYFVPYRRRSDVYFKQTHFIGSQPEGSVLVPNSERDQE